MKPEKQQALGCRGAKWLSAVLSAAGRRKPLKLQKAYTALRAADLAAAEAWYSKLLGRGPDNRPMEALIQWELFDHVGLALLSSTEIARRGVMSSSLRTSQRSANG